VIRCLRRIFRALQEYSKSTQRRYGLSSPQLWALTLLDAEPRLSLGELSERMFSHQSTVSGVVDRLVERGAVLREVDAEDRRGVRLSLTQAGEALVRSAPPPVQAGLSEALSRFPPSRLRQLRLALQDIVQQAELERIEAPLFESTNNSNNNE
jgi:DNA-binding MarR family transcriptional regulator